VNAASNTARRKRNLRVLSLVCLAAAVAVPFVTALIWGLQTAANMAQLVSLPVAALGVLGFLGFSLLPRIWVSQEHLPAPQRGYPLPDRPTAAVRLQPRDGDAAFGKRTRPGSGDGLSH
jgi:hypothetical protein